MKWIKRGQKKCRSYRQHELSGGCWELNLGLLEEQPVIFFFLLLLFSFLLLLLFSV